MKTNDDLELRSDDLGPRLRAWMGSTAPAREPAGLIAGASARAASVRQRPAFIVRLRLRVPGFVLPEFSHRTQLVLVAGLLLVGIGVASGNGARLLAPPTAPTAKPPTNFAGSSNSLIMLTADTNGPTGQIRVVRPDGLDVGAVNGYTNGCGRSVLVADGKRVAFFFNGAPLTIAPLDGAEPIIIRPARGTWSGWAFSPDRTRFAYLDGSSDLSDLTIVSLIDGSARVIARDLHHGTLFMAGWSVSDTLAIAFVNGPEARIDLIAADGTNRRPLALEPLKLTIPQVLVSWSPDGTRFAYTAATDAQPQRDTWVIDIATGRSTLVATADGQAVHAWAAIANAPYFRWSPDGRRVAYATGDNVALLDLATGESRIVADPLWGAGPFWSPDGTRLAFLEGSGPVRLTTLRADLTGRVDQVVDDNAGGIAWSPDSRQIVVGSGSALDLVDPDGVQPASRISDDGSGRGGCLTWSDLPTP